MIGGFDQDEIFRIDASIFDTQSTIGFVDPTPSSEDTSDVSLIKLLPSSTFIVNTDLDKLRS